MTTAEWLGCDLLESVRGKVSGAVVFKDTRLPVETIIQNVDAFVCSKSNTIVYRIVHGAPLRQGALPRITVQR
jgi:hypothetical protein